MTNSQIQSELRLFKGFTFEHNRPINQVNNYLSGIMNGIMFNTDVVPSNVIEEAVKMYGIKPETYNETFHKSFKVVRDSDILDLFLQQISHYITTYGFESLGIYDENTVYIPKEKLEIPELDTDVYLTIIKEIQPNELTERLMTLLTSGIALSQETIDDIMNLSDYINLDMVDEVKNKEVKIALYNKYHIVPGNNVEFLRYLINKATNRTLLIQDKSTINAIKDADTQLLWSELNGYVKLQGYYENNRFTKNPKNIDDAELTDGYKVLSKIFLRYKNLFLAMKRKDNTTEAKLLNRIINKISKLSHIYHTPLELNILDNITKIYTVQTVDHLKEQILKELDKSTVFREIRILNALKHRQFKTSNYYVYKIRNGKAFVREQPDLKIDKQTFLALYKLISNHLMNRVKQSIDGKSFYIPNNVCYALPTSEKQFNGNIPEGSYIEVPLDKSMVIGVHWTNLSNKGYEDRVDLDLKMRNKSESYGWNTSYRSTDRNFMFSGDVTDAPKPKGATEVFYIGTECENKSFTITLNKYTSNNAEVPFEFFIAYTDKELVDRDFVVDPNKVIIKMNNKFVQDKFGGIVNDMTLGMVKITDGVVRFYFNDFTTGDSIVSNRNFVTTGIHEYTTEYVDNQIKLEKFLEACGGIIWRTKSYSASLYYEKLEDGYKEMITSQRAMELTESGNGHLVEEELKTVSADYDLSLDSISKDTIIKLLTEVKK